MKWEHGRQNTGYDKLRLFIGKWFDCYLLRYPPGSCIPPHTDPVTNYQHFRLNIVLIPAQEGGEFSYSDPIFAWGPVKLFRSDRSTHSVSKVGGKRSRYVLSVGWIRRLVD
jgi:hypothetical protein